MNIESIELIREKSKQMIDAQIQSYRSLFTKAGTITGVLSIFFPLFLFLIESSVFTIKIISIIPILLALYGLINMLLTLKSPSLARGVKIDKFDELINYNIKKLKKYDIAYNKLSYQKNHETLKIMNKRYNWGLLSTIFSVVISITLLLCSNIFFYSEQKGKAMCNENETIIITNSENNGNGGELPEVDINDLEMIQEGAIIEETKESSDESNDNDEN